MTGSAVAESPRRRPVVSILRRLIGRGPLSEGDLLRNEYRILSVLGTGDLGTTYLAEPKRRGCRLIVKEFTARQVRSNGRSGWDLALPRGLAPRVIDDFFEKGRRYIVTKRVSGQCTLREFIVRNAPLSERTAVRIALGLAKTLGGLHDRGIVHRDVKPSNVLLTRDTRPVLLDFDIALAASRERAVPAGTECYASPEQYHGIADPRSDTYSLGAVIYEMLTARSCLGRFSFRPIQEVNPSISPELAALVSECLQLELDRRPNDAEIIRRLQLLNRRLRPNGRKCGTRSPVPEPSCGAVGSPRPNEP